MKADSENLRRLGSNESGMTLIELGVALLIIGLLMAAVVPSIEGLTGARARSTAGKLTGVIRYMYNESALTGQTCRMVFDMDKRAYWAECTPGHYVLNSQREAAHDGAKAQDPVEQEKLDEELDDDSSFGLTEEDAAEMKAEKKRILEQAQFSNFTDGTVSRQKLPEGVDLAVWTDHQREKYTKGTAYLYFFPEGYTERAQIYVSSGSTVYTLKVQPLTGKVKVADEALDLPEDIE